MADAEYKVIDPQAREAIERAFENQVAYCRDNGAPITASVNQALRALIETDRGGTVMLRVRKWAGPPLADALPLRLAGGLHALHLTGEEPALAPIYDGLEPQRCDRIGRRCDRAERGLAAAMAGRAAADERSGPQLGLCCGDAVACRRDCQQISPCSR